MRLPTRGVVLAVALVGIVSARVAAQPCTGDCSHDRSVAIDELVTCANIVLGRAPASGCPQLDRDLNDTTTIDELVGAVRTALLQSDQPAGIRASGSCFQPGATGELEMTPCQAGLPVRAYRCEDARRCLIDEDARTLVKEGVLGEAGTFSLDLDALDVRCASIIYEVLLATFDPGSPQRQRNIAPQSPVPQEVQEGIQVSPVSEASTRVLAQTGFENYNAFEIGQLSANVQTLEFGSLGGLSPDAAAARVTGIALADGEVRFRVIDFGGVLGLGGR
jgi:hypothetical protein